jgi:hypothetical protein
VEHLTGTLLPAVALIDREVDDVLDHSFPASDPPPWTMGGAETEPAAAAGAMGAVATRPGALAIGFRWATLTLGAAAVALLVPLFVVLLPLALMYRLVLTGWPIRHRASHADARRRASTQHVLTGI